MNIVDLFHSKNRTEEQVQEVRYPTRISTALSMFTSNDDENRDEQKSVFARQSGESVTDWEQRIREWDRSQKRLQENEPMYAFQYTKKAQAISVVQEIIPAPTKEITSKFNEDMLPWTAGDVIEETLNSEGRTASIVATIEGGNKLDIDLPWNREKIE